MKIGRPRVKTAERKGKITGVRFTEEERRLLERVARKSGCILSRWMRLVLLEAASVQWNTITDSSRKNGTDSQKEHSLIYILESLSF